MNENLFFALDVGTRSIVGIVGEKINNKMNILAVEQQEHQTRAMLDGQIHDVPLVTQVIADVRNRLEQKLQCKLNRASVAAAGRSLVTITTTSELDTSNILILDAEIEKTLELSAIQSAQQQLASDSKAIDPTGYYCVGYCTVNFILDGATISTLVGQRGQKAQAKIIATFLPRPVIDSMQTALSNIGIEIGTISLEPIAAINLLIPPTMRHLNLALVDIGAGTSDIAITKDGTVTGFGMVPCAGDEITEAISHKYLLDFNVAEKIKRLLTTTEQLEVHDILGMTNIIQSKEIVDSIKVDIKNLAQLIANEILTLNNEKAPQAVLLIGGGSLTPLLSKTIAELLDMPVSKVAIRLPENSITLPNIPKELLTPEAITPLGILCLVNSEHLNFVTIKMNGQLHRLFNLGKLKVADALLATGINIKNLKGKPGMGMRIEINSEAKYLPGTLGTPSILQLNNQNATLDDELKDRDELKVVAGVDGLPAKSILSDLVDCSCLGYFYVNEIKYPLNQNIVINGQNASPETVLKDNDCINVSPPFTIQQALNSIEMFLEETSLSCHINNKPIHYNLAPKILQNGSTAELNSPIKPNDTLEIKNGEKPTLERLLQISNNPKHTITILFNEKPLEIECVYKEIYANSNKIDESYQPNSGDMISVKITDKQPIVSDALLASKFDPREFLEASNNEQNIIEILLNNQKAEFTSPIFDGNLIATNIIEK